MTAAEDKFSVSLLTHRYCPESIKKMNISFAEYNKLMESFRNLDQENKDAAYQISVQAIAWQDWYSSLQNIIAYIIKSIDTDRNARIAYICQTCGEKSITKAEKVALMDDDVVVMKKQKAIAEAIYGLLDDKVKILEKVFYFCRTICSQQGGDQIQQR